MSEDTKHIAERTASAMAAIRQSLDDGDEDSTVALFVSHHLEELDASYWKQHTGSPRPSPKQVVNLLELRSHWGAEDAGGVDNIFDFTLPGKVTDYVISVRFGEGEDVQDIEMES